jgi:hypothetical protein
MTLEKLFNKMFGYPCWDQYTTPGDKWRGLSADKIEELYQAQHRTRFFRFLYWLESDLPSTVWCKWKWLSDNTYWAFRHRFIQKEWMVDTKLNRYKYHEPDTVLIASIFEQLVEFIEVCKPWTMEDDIFECYKTEDPEYYEQRSAERRALLDAYDYWKVARPAMEKAVEDIYKELPPLDTKNHSVFYFFTEEESKGRGDRMDRYKAQEEIENKIEELDEKHLISIIKHRRSLWT